MSRPGAVVIACHWFRTGSELSFVTRLLAGGLSRCGPLSVLVPGSIGTRTPDGAFDLEGIGDEREFHWPSHLAQGQTILVDELTPAVELLLTRAGPRQVLCISAPRGSEGGWRCLDFAGATGDDDTVSVDLHVPINRLAERHRHHGFGFTDYQLVLSDRAEPSYEPPPAAAWVTAAFFDADVVVVEAATASAWKGRSLRGQVAIDTRMDLWRLFAHASTLIDLAPGPFVARECIEALRFGTPIVVPAASKAAAAHARRAGGSTFSDAAELIDSVSMFRDPTARSIASATGRRYAEEHFGDLPRFIADLRLLLPAE